MVKTLSERWLPNDLLPGILWKLPAKSVIRFRSVSKTWRGTIENPEFIESYKKPSESQIFVLHLEHGKVELAVRCTNTFRVVNAAEHSFPTVVRNAHRVIGCVDGLFLLETQTRWENKLLLWNPSIRRVSNLPPQPSITNLNLGCDYTAEDLRTWSVGIGFDPWIKDYKHVRISRKKLWINEIASVMVYTMGSNSWRQIPFKNKGDKPWYFTLKFEFEKVCVRGILYLIALTIHKSVFTIEKQQLVSFDLSTEEFNYADLPIQDDVEYHSELHLKCASDGSRLTLVYIRRCNGLIWLAHGEGGDVTWGKHYSFHLTSPVGFPGGLGYVLNIDLNTISRCDGDDCDEASVILLLRIGDSASLYSLTQTREDNTLLDKGKMPSYYHLNTFFATSYVETLRFLN